MSDKIQFSPQNEFLCSTKANRWASFGRQSAAVLFGVLSIGFVGCNPRTPVGKTTVAVSSAPVLFENVTAQSGIDFQVKQTKSPLTILETLGHGAGMIDADGDGKLDLVLLGMDKVKLYRNEGDFRFRDMTETSGLKQTGYWEGIAVGDYDNDGKSDLYLCGYNQSALYHNEGGGRFRDVTAQAGLLPRKVGSNGVGDWRTSAGFADLDNDGKLDLYVCRYAEFGPKTIQFCSDVNHSMKYSCAPDVYQPQRGSLYHNIGGKFQDVTQQAGLGNAGGRALGIAFADYNDDGKLDFALANDMRPGDLYENQGKMKFVNRGEDSGTGLDSSGHVHGGMGIDWGDTDNDGRLDLFVATYEGEEKTLYQNQGQGLFTIVSVQAGLTEPLKPWVSFGTKLFDYDNDGILDLMITSGHVIDNTADITPGTQFKQPIQLFHGQNGSYQEVTAQLDASAQKPIVGRALAVGDLDDDGKLDIVITDHDGATMILRNRSADAGHRLTLHLVGIRSNRDGFGARVTVEAGGKKQVRDVTNAGSFLSAHDSRLHFGLGNATQADRVTVRWTNGKTETFSNLTVDKIHVLTEGKASP